MFGALVVLFLQAATPEALTPPETPTTTEVAATTTATPVVPAGMMDCQYNRQTRVRLCTTSTGEVLQCRRERTLGSRFPTNVCFTYRENEVIERDSRAALDHQQRITTPDLGD